MTPGLRSSAAGTNRLHDGGWLSQSIARMYNVLEVEAREADGRVVRKDDGVKQRLWLVPLAVVLIVAACGDGQATDPGSVPATTTPAPPTVDQAAPPSTPTGEEIQPTDEELEDRLRNSIRFSVEAWPRTTFEKHSVPLGEFMGGGPGKDEIPALDHPPFVPVSEADEWLGDREPVQLVNIGGDARAYPQQVLIWHELVNDTVGGEPILVTF